MARDITLTFEDGSTHVYNGAPDDVTPDMIEARAARDFAGKRVANMDGGRRGPAPGAAKFVDGKAQIPGLAPGQEGMVPANPNPPPPDAPAGEGFLAKLTGAVQAARATVNGILGGSIGAAGGLVEGLVKTGMAGKLGTPEGANMVEQTAGTRAAQLSKSSAPLNMAGQRYMHNVVEPFGQAMMPLAGHMNPGMEFPGSMEAAGQLAQRVGDQGRMAGMAVKDAGLNAAAGMAKVNPQKLENAGVAIDAGLDVPLHAIGDRGPLVKTAGETLGHLPLSGSKVDSNVRTFNRKVIEQINPNEAGQQLTPKVVNGALKAAGKTIGDNMRAVTVPMEDLSPHVGAIRSGLETATTDARSVVGGYLGQLEAKAAENGGAIPGAALRELDTKIGEQLRSFAGKHPDIENRLADLQDAIRDTASARMTPEQAAATQVARQRYAKTMSLIPAYEDIRNEGYLQPGKLMDLVANSPLSKRLMATGQGGAWQDLAAAGELVAPKSGATRARVVGGTVTAGGGGLYLGTTGAASPAGLVAGAGGVLGAANLYNRAGPRIVKALVKRERARNAPPEPPPEPPLTTSPGAGGESGPRGGTVLPPPQDGPLGPAGPDLTTSPGAGGVELPSDLSPAEARLASRLTPFDDQPMTEKPPRRIIKSDAPTVVSDAGPTRPRRPIVEAPVERRGLRAVPPVEGRPDLPPEMVAGGLADRPGQTSEVASNTTSGVTGAGKGVRATEGNPEAMRSEGAALGRRKIIEDRYAAAGGQAEPGNHPAPKPPAAEPAPAPADPRLAEIEALRAKADSPAVLAALKKREAAVRRAMAEEDAARQRETDAAALDDAARKAQDPETKALLKAEADKLREPIPAGETKEGFPPAPAEPRGKIPVGKTREVPLPAAGRDGELRAPMPLPEVEELPVQRVEGGEPIPRGEATEVEPVPVGQADEMLPVGQADELVPVGDASEMLPTGEATEGPPPMAPAPKPRIIAPPGAPPGQAPMPPAPKPAGPAGGGLVAGPDGKPLVLYRAGSGAGKPTRSKTPYFATNEADARDYAAARKDEGYGAADTKIRKAHIKAEKLATDADIERVAQANGLELAHPDYPAAYLDRSPELVDALKKEGFDGAVGLDGRPSDGKEIKSYVVFDRGQVVDVAPGATKKGTRNAAQEKPQPASVQAEPEGRAGGGQAAEAGAGDRVQRPAEGGGQAPGPAGDAGAKEPWRLSREEAAKDYPGDQYDKMINRAADLGDMSYVEADRISRIKSGDGGKKLWAMTRKELEAQGKGQVASAKADRAEWNKSVPTKEFAKWRIAAGNRTRKAAVDSAREYNDSLLAVHKERVQEALMEGKDVPAEVLADYPDLKRPGAQEVTPVVPATTNRQNAPKRLIAPRKPENKPMTAPTQTPAPAPSTATIGARVRTWDGGDLATVEAIVTPAEGDRVARVKVKVDGGGTREYRADRLDLAEEGAPAAPAAAPAPKGMTLEEAKAHMEEANRERPLGGSWAKIEAMQGGKLKGASTQTPAPTPTPAPRPAAAPKAPKPMIQSMKPSERLAELNRQIDAEARYGAGGPERITLRAGGTTQTIDNSPEGVARWREAAGKSYGFKDTKTPKPPSGREPGGGPGATRPANAANQRTPKTVVQGFVADGDFENAQALAEHYGLDIKAGMDAKQKRAYQDWLDGPPPAPPEPPKPAAPPVEPLAKEPPASPPPAKNQPESLGFDEWVRHSYRENDHAPAYLEAHGEEKRAMLASVVGTTDKDMPLRDLLKEARNRYWNSLMARPRDATMSLEVWDSLPHAQQVDAQRHFYNLDNDILRRDQQRAKAAGAARRKTP